ncbi:MAG: hypothetical protein KC506_03985 [Nanoarchaeota archaeon]|nr:hypothetical protein [Nanoarchaeota archaeon]
MYKKGEATSGQIVTFALVIFGFIVILIAYFTVIDVKGTSQDEVCRLSVLTRATSPEATQRLLPLKCTTEKICLTRNGEECPAFIGEESESPSLSGTEEQAAEKVEEIVANEIYDCWNMMGQGKLGLFGGGKTETEALVEWTGLGRTKTSCVICSRIAIAPDLVKDKDFIKKVDVNEFMEYKKAPGQENKNYLQAMSGDNVRSYTGDFTNKFANETIENSTDEIGVIFMQILTEEGVFESFTDIGLTTGGFILGGSVGLGAGGLVLNPIGALTALASSTTTATIAAFQTYQDRQVSFGHCGDLASTEDEALKGCSIITTFDYHKIEELNNFCGRVEGTPK